MPEPTPEEGYQSPYSWRYGSAAMRHVWSEVEKRRIWRQIWVALAEAQLSAGLVTPDQVADLKETLKAHEDSEDEEEGTGLWAWIKRWRA